MHNSNKIFKIVIAGRPNVGKSTIFNIFVQKRVAIEFSEPGTTRDPIEKIVEIDDQKVLLIDTGGFEFESKDPLYNLIGEKAKEAICSSDLVLFVVEKDKIIDEDLAFLRFIKKNSKKYILVVNKSEGKYKEILPTEIYRLGVKTIIPISAIHRDNIDVLEENIIKIINEEKDKYDNNSNNDFHDEYQDLKSKSSYSFRLAIVGRPNTGKSTLLNCIIKKDKAIVSDIPGTTRDAIETTIDYKNHRIILTDTAGIRKKSKIDTDLEYYCIKRSFYAIDSSDIVIHLVDSNDFITSQDKKISDYIINKGKGYILALNKIDLLSNKLVDYNKNYNKNIDQFGKFIKNLEGDLNFQFPQILYVKKFFISAKNNFNVESLLDYCLDLFYRINKQHKTSQLNKVIEKIAEIKPILIGSSFLNLFYMVEVKRVPRIYKVFTNKDPGQIPAYYTQYIINELRNNLNLESIPIKIKFEKRK
ncbi:MAG: ribosome biogenesis GTPase Der [Exilispira sp.]